MRKRPRSGARDRGGAAFDVPRGTRRRASATPATTALLVLACALGGGCRRRPAPAGARDAAAASSKGAAAAGAAATREHRPVRIFYPSAPGSFVELAAELAPAVVSIRSTAPVTGGPDSVIPGQTAGGKGPTSLGSGVIVDRDGDVLTNDHLIEDAPSLRVVLRGGDAHPAKVIGRDPRLDLALLKIQGGVHVEPAPLGDSDRLKVGEWVVALGDPFGDQVTASAGIVSALGAGGGAMVGPNQRDYRSFVETDADITPANSGGPLVDMAGRVVGINAAVDAREGRIGFAVPISRAKQVLPMLKKSGAVTRAWLGVFIHPVTPAVGRRAGLKKPTGALVSGVVANSPAAKAGIRRGDIILAFDGKPVDHRDLPWIAANAGIGRTVAVKVWRHGAAVTLKLVTEKMPQ